MREVTKHQEVGSPNLTSWILPVANEGAAGGEFRGQTPPVPTCTALDLQCSKPASGSAYPIGVASTNRARLLRSSAVSPEAASAPPLRRKVLPEALFRGARKHEACHCETPARGGSEELATVSENLLRKAPFRGVWEHETCRRGRNGSSRGIGNCETPGRGRGAKTSRPCRKNLLREAPFRGAGKHETCRRERGREHPTGQREESDCGGPRLRRGTSDFWHKSEVFAHLSV
jgi:hypothetical protein